MAENLWNSFKLSSDRSVLFIIRPNPKHKVIQIILQLTSFMLYLTEFVIVLINVVQQKEGLVMSVINAMFLIMIFGMCIITIELIIKKDNIIELISWCTEPTWKKFHKSMLPEAGNKFLRIRNLSAAIILFNIKLYDVLSLLTTFIVGIAMQIIPSLRYNLALPWHLPIENYKTWPAFFTTLLIQTAGTVALSQVISFFVSFIVMFYLHVKEYVEIILCEYEKLNEKLRNKRSTECVDVNESLKILVIMIENYIRILTKFSTLMSNILMCLEIISIATIFCNAFILLIVKKTEHYFIAWGIMTFNLNALGIAYINEKFKDMSTKISNALYELPWDELSPEQRRFIQFSMKCIDVDITLNSGNIHEFSLERFGDITTKAYSNTLILKRILEKV
uniref:Odorant receptor n=1 Tax=Culicoides sonorensis TaxID=179676 RepID=A0A336M758_CULSO